MIESQITDQEFASFQRLIYKIAGISLSEAKKILLVGRLQRRLRHYDMATFTQYYRMLVSGQHPEELQTMVDLLTTNETYFFREPKHFTFLRDEVLAKWRGPQTLRIWSAASSTGEEAYTLAMLLDDTLPNSPWEIFGSDISTQVLEKARRGHYPLGRHEGIPERFLKKYCRKGVRGQEGTFLIEPELRQRVSFEQINLTLPVDKSVGMFEVIFLRNVMIYFDTETKRKVVQHLLPHLVRGGYFIIGHAETLNGISEGLSVVRPTIYRKD
jgi:chemotaxis protein methyltransferase CheR